MNKPKRLINQCEEDIIKIQEKNIESLLSNLETLKPTDEEYPICVNKCFDIITHYSGCNFNKYVNMFLTRKC